MTKPLLSQWIAAERKRHGWKVGELSRRLEAAGFEGAEPTVRTWEAGRRPAPETITALERMFESAAPAEADPSLPGLVAALRDQTEAINALVGELRAERERGQDAATAMMRAAEALLSAQQQRGAEESREPVAPGGSAR